MIMNCIITITFNFVRVDSFKLFRLRNLIMLAHTL